MLNVTDVGARFNGKVVILDSCKAGNELSVKILFRTLLSKVKVLNGLKALTVAVVTLHHFTDKYEAISVDIGKRKNSGIDSNRS